jgi:hypothetical protein
MSTGLIVMGCVLLLVGVVIMCALVVAATRPNSFRLERSLTINAPPDQVFARVNDFKLWTWSPWEHIDPNLKRSYSGTDAGVGTVYGWEGNKKVGSGRMEITHALPPSHLRIKLDFFTPFEAHNTTEFTFQAVKAADPGTLIATEVTWAMHGPQPFFAKLMSLVFSMEKMVGPDFEKGLAALKTEAEQVQSK